MPTPRGADAWYCSPTGSCLEEVQTQLDNCGFTTGRGGHALSHDGAPYLGVMEVKLPDQAERDYAWVVGLRNSHYKTFPAGLVADTSVFACDNLPTSGEVKISRKHTRFAYRDLRNLTAWATSSPASTGASPPTATSRYKTGEHDLVIRTVDCWAITPSQVPEVVQEWREPSHANFRPRNLWSLFNTFTEACKRQSPMLTLARSEELHGLCDGAVGLN